MLHRNRISAFIVSNIYTSAVWGSLVIDQNNSGVRLQTQGGIHQKRRQLQQSVCSPPPAGCGYGIWNEGSCECNCINPYCFDTIFQQCISPGDCPNPFEGCVPYATCPYYANFRTGKCESSDTVAPGVYTAYWTAEECCQGEYPDSFSSCMPTLAPTASPLLTTNVENPEESSGAIGVKVLAPIPISFINLPDQFELSEKQRKDIVTAILQILLPASDDMNISIVSVDAVDEIFSGQPETLPLTLQITVSGEEVELRGVESAFIGALHSELYTISNVLKESWGPGVYTNNVILEMGGVQTTKPPSRRPSNLDNDAISTPTNSTPTDLLDDPDDKSLPVWVAILIALIFAFLCGGVLVWQRRRYKQTHLEEVDDKSPHHNSFFLGDEESLVAPSIKVVAVDDSQNQNNYHHSRRETNSTMQINQMESLKSRQSHKRNMNANRPPPTNGDDPPPDKVRHEKRSKPRQNRSKPRQIPMGVDFSYRSRRSQMSGLYNNESSTRQMNEESGIREWHQPYDQNNDKIPQSPASLEPEGTKSFNESMCFTQSATNINQAGQFEQSHQRFSRLMEQNDDNPVNVNVDEPTRAHMSRQVQSRTRNRYQGNVEPESLDGSGYDAGRSSLLLDAGRVNAKEYEEDSSSEDFEANEDSEDGHVLGLLYYDGASSACESEAKESRRSRRSRRTHRSKHSGKTKSTKSRSSKSRSSEYITKHLRVDSLSGSIVYANESIVPTGLESALGEKEFIPENTAKARGTAQSAYSHGSTIGTDDIHRMDFSHSGCSDDLD